MAYSSDDDVTRLNEPGKFSFGGGLYLQVQGPRAKSWLYRYTLRGKQRWHGLGSASELTLRRATRARDLAQARVQDDKVDVVEQSKSTRAAKIYRATGAVTFRDAAAVCIKAKRSMWSNSKHAAQWEASLANYAYPIIGDMPVAAIERQHVVEVLAPIWLSKRETANRLRGRIEDVLVTAMAHRWRPETEANPAQLTKLLRQQLPARPKRKEKHHAALAHEKVGAFMHKLNQREGLTPRALAFTILTAVRTGESLGARWSEFDLDARTWAIPASRMKASRDHVVALSGAAMEVLAKMEKQREGEFVFAGVKHGRPLSNMAMLKLVRGMGFGHITPHGFRSTFKDFCRDELGEADCPDWLSEAILAHESGDKVLRAYARTEAIKLRRKVMEAWAAYCTGPESTATPADNVVRLAKIGGARRTRD